MGRFKRKANMNRIGHPVKVEAYRFGPHMDVPGVYENAAGHSMVATVDGISIRVKPGDWVLIDERGFRHVMAPELFAVIYEPVVPKESQK